MAAAPVAAAAAAAAPVAASAAVAAAVAAATAAAKAATAQRWRQRRRRQAPQCDRVDGSQREGEAALRDGPPCGAGVRECLVHASGRNERQIGVLVVMGAAPEDLGLAQGTHRGNVGACWGHVRGMLGACLGAC